MADQKLIAIYHFPFLVEQFFLLDQSNLKF